MNRNSWIGTLEIIIGSIGFGFLGIFGKLAFQNDLNIGELLTFRFSLAAVLLGISLALLNRNLLKFSRQQIFISSLLGIFGYAIFASLYFTAIKGLSVALAAMLLYTYPIFVSLFQHFIKKDHLKAKEWLCLLGVLTGLAFLLWGEVEIKSWWFVLAGLGSAVTYAIYILLSAHYQKGVKPITSSFYVMLAAALALAVIHRPDFSRALTLTPTQHFIILGIAIICTIGPLTFILAGLQKLTEAQAALISTVEPVTATFAAVLLLGETMTISQILGATFILTSLGYLQFTRTP